MILSINIQESEVREALIAWIQQKHGISLGPNDLEIAYRHEGDQFEGDTIFDGYKVAEQATAKFVKVKTPA